jgi:type II secretion system protein G
MKWLRAGQRGFTLIEILVVIGILGLMAGIIVPNVSGFIGTGSLAAARTELANVKIAALAYRGQNDAWPATSGDLRTLIDGDPKAVYTFDSATGFVDNVTSHSWSGITWTNPPGSSPYTRDGTWDR